MHWHEDHHDQADQSALIDERDLATHIPPELLGDDDELRPVDWNTLPADEAWRKRRDLNEWVDWIRMSHGLPATVIAPLWHHHDEMVWELSAQPSAPRTRGACRRVTTRRAAGCTSTARWVGRDRPARRSRPCR